MEESFERKRTWHPFSLKFIFALTLILVSLPAFSDELFLPSDSTSFEKSSAESILTLCTAHTKSGTKSVFEKFGFRVLRQKNFDRPRNVIDHSSAFTIGSGSVNVAGERRTAYIIAIRGTDGNEWFSNFDFAPSASEDVHFSSNFLSSAEEVFLEFLDTCPSENPTVIVCGHSRGAALSNLTALLLNQLYGHKNVYAYTFATPATIRNLENLDDGNIFNILNPCDVVPMLPSSTWGFSRAGTDIFLDDESEKINAQELKKTLSSLGEICPSINSYYKDRHSLTSAGLSENGVTVFEIFLSLATRLSLLTAEGNEEGDFWDLSKLEGRDGDFSIPSFATGSDYDLLFGCLSRLSKNGGRGFLDLLGEHMPETYRLKLSRLEK